MAIYPIKMLKDEAGTPFIPLVAPESVIDTHGDTLADMLESKVNEPETEGTSGQVLTTDGEGGRTWTTVQGGGGTSDYTALSNKPSINNVTLTGNKTSSDLGLQPAGTYITPTDYAVTDGASGVVKVGTYGARVNSSTGQLYAINLASITEYNNANNNTFVSKGTLEKVLGARNATDTTVGGIKCRYDSSTSSLYITTDGTTP